MTNTFTDDEKWFICDYYGVARGSTILTDNTWLVDDRIDHPYGERLETNENDFVVRLADGSVLKHPRTTAGLRDALNGFTRRDS